MAKGLIGQVITPATGNRLEPDVDWIGDNAVFGGAYPGDDAYIDWLFRYADRADRCRFIVAPDVVCDADATWKRSAPMMGPIRTIGFPVGYVAQNGATADTLPWDQFDALFLGGDTEWKLGPEARALTAEAKTRGKHVHMGRVNSLRRLRYAQAIGCDSADGTYLAFGPDTNLPKLLGWLGAVNDQFSLFVGGAS